MSQELGSTLWLQDPGCKTFTLWPDASFLVWTDPGPDLVLSETNHNTVTSNIIDQHDPRAFLDDKTVEVKAWQTHCQLQVLVWGEQPHPKYYIHWNFQIKILRIFHLQSSYCASQWTRYSLSTTPHALRDTTLLRTAWQNDFVALVITWGHLNSIVTNHFRTSWCLYLWYLTWNPMLSSRQPTILR